MTIDRTLICEMLPHGDSMCLLDEVRSWDRQQIVCITGTHRLMDNPLRNTDGLPMISLMEYGAQAMAIHGCLLAEKSGVRMQEGYLASLRDVELADGWLSDVDAVLEIHAKQIFMDGGNMIYTLVVRGGSRKYASARITAMGKLVEESCT